MRFAWAAMLGALTLAPAGAQTAPTALVKAGITNALADAPFYVADKRGYFAQEGLKVELVSFDAAARMVAPLASGELDAGGGGIAAGLFNAVARGVGAKIVADKSTSAPGQSTGALMVRKDLIASGKYKTPADLRGAKLALPAAGTGTSTSLDLYFRKFGLSLKDMDLVYLSFPQTAAALANGAIDAGFLTEPSVTSVISKGYAETIAGDDVMFPNHQIAVTQYSEKFIRERRGVAVRFMRATLLGCRDYMDSLAGGHLAGPKGDAMISILVEYSLLKDPAVYREMAVHGCDPDGSLNLASLKADLDYFKSQGLIEGQVEVADAIDPGIATEALKSIGSRSNMRSR